MGMWLLVASGSVGIGVLVELTLIGFLETWGVGVGLRFPGKEQCLLLVHVEECVEVVAQGCDRE